MYEDQYLETLLSDNIFVVKLPKKSKVQLVILEFFLIKFFKIYNICGILFLVTFIFKFAKNGTVQFL